MTGIEGDRFEVRRMRADEWRALRAMRLEALENSPLSYGTTHGREILRVDAEWRERAAAGAAGEHEVAIAALAGGRWVGMARGYLEPPIAHLIAVYVTPAWRRQGIAEALSRAVATWARERGASAILLSVSDWNDGARRVYEAIGFVPNGVHRTLPWNDEVWESEMRLELE
jgi:GNAT superfamily N-acetyltransferase